MLSETYSVNDVKVRLVHDYSTFGYLNEADFTIAIINALEDTKLLRMFPHIGSAGYTVIQDKDKGVVEDLTESQEYVYWAEVFYACVEFLKLNAASTDSMNSSESESLSVEGYSYSSSSGTNTENSMGVKEYLRKATKYMVYAGYNPYQLQKTSGIFGEGNEYKNIYPEVV